MAASRGNPGAASLASGEQYRTRIGRRIRGCTREQSGAHSGASPPARKTVPAYRTAHCFSLHLDVFDVGRPTLVLSFVPVRNIQPQA